MNALHLYFIFVLPRLKTFICSKRLYDIIVECFGEKYVIILRRIEKKKNEIKNKYLLNKLLYALQNEKF